jgi:hypothetical protein
MGVQTNVHVTYVTYPVSSKLRIVEKNAKYKKTSA